MTQKCGIPIGWVGRRIISSININQKSTINNQQAAIGVESLENCKCFMELMAVDVGAVVPVDVVVVVNPVAVISSVWNSGDVRVGGVGGDIANRWVFR